MIDILTAAMYALVFLAVSVPLLVIAFYTLDVITPGHKLGDRIAGDLVPSQGLVKHEGSFSAAIVTSAWMIMQALIIFTSIWTNAHGTDFLPALGWSIFFSLIGLVFQTIAFMALDAVTPGILSDEICAPGKLRPLAILTAANVVAVGVVVIAVIS